MRLGVRHVSDLDCQNAEVAHYSAKSMLAEVAPRNPALVKRTEKQKLIQRGDDSFKAVAGEWFTVAQKKKPKSYAWRAWDRRHPVSDHHQSPYQMIRKVGDSTAQGSRQTSYLRLLTA